MNSKHWHFYKQEFSLAVITQYCSLTTNTGNDHNYANNQVYM